MPKAFIKSLDGGRVIRDGTIDVGDVADGTLTLAKLSSATIPSARIAANAVTAAKISALTVTGAKLSAGAIITSKLGAAAVGNAAMSAASVKAAAISALTITGAKLSAGAVIQSKLGTAAVGNAALSAASVKAAALSALTITGAKISAGAIINSKLSKPYVIQQLPFMFSAATSGDAAIKHIGYARYDSYPVGIAYSISGTAAAPTVKVQLDVHYRKAGASALVSTNSFFRTGAKATQAASLSTMGFTVASTATTLIPSGCAIIVQKAIQGSAAGTTFVEGVVLMKVPLQA